MKLRIFNKFDLTKDKTTKFSVRIDLDGEQKLTEAPYPLNIIDRSYLIAAFRYNNLEIKHNQINRVFSILGSRLCNKILSIVFFALVASI